MDTLHRNADLLHSTFLTELADLGRPRVLDKGEVLFHRDDPGEFVFLVLDGLIEISVTSAAGRKSVLAHCGPGEVLGEISVLDGKPRSADAVALKPCTGRAIWRRDLTDYLSRTPASAMSLIEALCGRIRNASDRFETNAMTSAAARLATCLLALGEKWGEPMGDGMRISEPFSQSELGAFAGLARENVNRYVSRWSREGIIAFDNCMIDILDQRRLEELAEE